jgi:hypothetical protein
MRCRKARSRRAITLRPVEELSWRELAARLTQIDPEQWGPPLADGLVSGPGDDLLDGDHGSVIGPLDGPPEDDSLAGLLARLDAADDGLELSTGSRRRERR